MTINKVLADAHIQIDVNTQWYPRDPELYAKRLEMDARDIKDFVRDHRSMDIHDVYVVRDYMYVCSHCKQKYEYDNEKPECCAYALFEWNTKEEMIAMGWDEEQFMEAESSDEIS